MNVLRFAIIGFSLSMLGYLHLQVEEVSRWIISPSGGKYT